MRKEACGVLVVSHRREKFYKNQEILLTLSFVCLLFSVQQLHTDMYAYRHSEEPLSAPMVRVNRRPLLTYGHWLFAALQAEPEPSVDGTAAPQKKHRAVTSNSHTVDLVRSHVHTQSCMCEKSPVLAAKKKKEKKRFIRTRTCVFSNNLLELYFLCFSLLCHDSRGLVHTSTFTSSSSCTEPLIAITAVKMTSSVSTVLLSAKCHTHSAPLSCLPC